MANQVQLRLLQQGVEAWNKWRTENPHEIINLTGADLREMNLQRINFRGATLTCANFNKANLCEATIQGADIRGASFKDANLQGADLAETTSGLENLQKLFLLFLVSLISLISGSIIGSAGFRVNIIFGLDLINRTGNISGLTALVVHTILLFSLLYFVDAVTGLWILGISTALAAIGIGIFTSNITASTAVVVSVLVAAIGVILRTLSAIMGKCLAGKLFSYFNILISASSAFLIAYPEIFLGSIAALVSSACTYVGWQGIHKRHEFLLLERTAILFSSLGGTNFYKADLSEANFTGANVINTDISKASLHRVCWLQAKNIHLSYVVGTYLRFPRVRQLLNIGETQGKDYQNLDLRSTNLRTARLSDADFIGTNFDGADLQDVDFSNSNLKQTRFDGAILAKACLTGACIEDWHINSDTKLDNVNCEYVYLKENQKERRPSDKDRTFAPGEFTKLFQKALNTVDLIFADGIDWQAFLLSFQELQTQYTEKETSIQAIEKKSGGSFVVRLEVSAEVDKAEIERFVMEKYDVERKKLEAEYQQKLQIKEQEIAIYKRESANMTEIAKLLASRTLNVENKVVAENISNDFRNAKATNIAPQGIASGGIFNDFSTAQDLTDAASKIQTLLSQLQQQGETPESAHQKVAEDLAEQAKKDPAVLGKLVMWGQKLSDATVTDVVKGVVKLALRSAGVPLP